MSEPVLKSIIQLLALSATIDGSISDSERKIIYAFIHENLSEENAQNFISLFNDYTEIAIEGNIEVPNICKRINIELNSKQKIVVLLHLLELVSVDGAMGEAEIEFIDNIVDAFNIDRHEYNIMKAFVTDEEALHLGLNNILVISGQKMNPKIKHIYKRNFSATVGILRIPSLEMYMLKYFAGDSNTFLNGILLKDRHIYTFSNGSSIRNELITPIYYSDVVSHFLEEDQETKIAFEAKHLYYTFPGGKIGLRDINIVEESGRLVGIMGSSGSGKSTLINVLNGNEIPIGGKITINGIDVHDEGEKTNIKGIIGYVPQDDLLIEELTVFQNMYFAAKLCFSNYTEDQIRELVNKTLQNLGLLETADLKVGNVLQKTISGGQRKRLNIGLELLREPAVMFLDEPTSGLSSSDSENIVDLLKELSLKGKLIFVVIHQPSSDIFKMFDRLIILDIGGYQIYYGNPIEAVTYFKTLANLVNPDQGICPTCGNVNPEQIFNIIETKVVDEYGRYTNQRKVSPVQWRKHYEEDMPQFKSRQVDEKPNSTLRLPSRFRQWLIFAKRDMLAKLSNTQYMVISLLEAPLLALILSYIVRYYHIDHALGQDRYVFSDNLNIPAYIFMSIIVALFIGLTVSAEEIIKDAKILKREAFLHLSRTSYLLSKVIILFSFSFIQTFSYVLIGNWILEIHGMYFSYTLILFSTACFANMLGLNISSTFNSVITVYILIPILLIPQLILGGIVVKFDDINPKLASENKVPLISEVMTARWAFEAMMVSQFKDNPFEKKYYEFDKAMAIAEYKRTYLISRLQSKLSYCINNFNSTEISTRDDVDRNINLLSREISKELQVNKAVRFTYINRLNPDLMDLEVAEEVKKYLEALRKYYIRKYNQTNKIKEQIITKLTKTPKQRDQFVALSQKYHNEMVAAMVKKADEPVRIVEINNKLIQKIYPVFQDPLITSNYFDFRTHFYAPRKQFLGFYIDTLIFNALIIWAMTFILYITLYYKIFRESFKVFAMVLSRKKKKMR
ncbi:MAG: ATP-binding cassette domain-containing protein [Microscillaceae bacterium]|nr:ATP-binding cassette domain-containing protein [Microscillaceae bacterium]